MALKTITTQTLFYKPSGKTILIETKGDHLDGTDSEAKCRLDSNGNDKQEIILPFYDL